MGDRAGDGDRIVGRTYDVLIGIPLHGLQVLGNSSARDGNALAVQVAVIEQGFHQERYAPYLEHVFGDITAARFQIRDIWCPFEDLGNIEQIELDAAFMSDCGQMQRRIGGAA